MRLEEIDPERLLSIAKSGSETCMRNALINVANAIKKERTTVPPIQ